MGVLEGEPVGRLAVEGGALAVADAGGEVGSLAGEGGALAYAVDQSDGIVLQVVRADAGALVGVSDGATVLQAPLAAGGDGAIDAARPGGGAGDDAGVARIERRRYLHHQCHVLPPGAVVGVGQALGARNQALVSRSEERRVGKECRSRW